MGVVCSVWELQTLKYINHLYWSMLKKYIGNGYHYFKMCNGWLGWSRKWHHIAFNEVCSDCDDVSEETVANWVAKLPSGMDTWGSKHITNDDEDWHSTVMWWKNFVLLGINNMHNIINTIPLLYILYIS